MHSFRSVLNFQSGKVGSANHTQLKFQEATQLLCQGLPTGDTRTPKGYEIEHQGVRRSLGHRAAYISLIEQYISQNFFGGY